MSSVIIVFLILLILIDVLMIVGFIFLYFRFKKVFELPWEDIKESIEKAQQLVRRLEELRERERQEVSVPTKPIREQILGLANKGYNSKEIARILKLSEAEVEVVLASKKLDR